MGPLMLDVEHYELQGEERDMLAHPLTGGVILFTRNYHDKRQLEALIKAVRKAAHKPLIIGVDHEGGRVQRFRDGFTRLPAPGQIAALTEHEDDAHALARACGVIMAYELKQLNIDISFAPVLDKNGISQVIGDRAFACEVEDIVTLASHFIAGMKACDMPATGKHFPGHGSIAPDSHIALPEDLRSFAQIEADDMRVFSTLIQRELLDGIMPAHVIYPNIDPQPAGFSSYWLQTVLRKQLGFQGAIFSDDLSMHGASLAGDYHARAQAALTAGCDMILACNNRQGAAQILDKLKYPKGDSSRLLRLANRRLPASASATYHSSISQWQHVFAQ